MSEIISKLNPNFYIAAFIPSLGFLLTLVFFFKPIFPPSIAAQIPTDFSELVFSSLLFLALTVILGFTLSSLNNFIYKLVEGYMLLERFKRPRKKQQEKAEKLKQQIKKEENALEKILQTPSTDPQFNEVEFDEDLQRAQDRVYYLKSLYQSDFPPDIQSIMPTRFGNIFRAAEYYSADRYGLDAVPLWPRLINAMPDRYYARMEQSNSGLAFVINCMVLSIGLTILCLIASVYQFSVWGYANYQFEGQYQNYVRTVSQPKEREDVQFLNAEPLYFVPVVVSVKAQHIYVQRALLYIVLSVVSFAVTLLFYRASLPIARQYGNLIRSAYDLYRFQLLEQLRFDEFPNDTVEEHQIWRKISEFIVVGDPNRQLVFNYKEQQESGSL